jgi:hypothetical protein
MFTLRFLTASLIVLLVTAPGDSGDSGDKKPIDNKQLIGVWQWRGEMGVWCYPPRSCAAKYEFTKDGKIKSSDNVEGTYELAGETLKLKLGGKTVTWTIVRLDAAELIIEVGKLPVVDGDDAWRMRSFEKK